MTYYIEENKYKNDRFLVSSNVSQKTVEQHPQRTKRKITQISILRETIFQKLIRYKDISDIQKVKEFNYQQKCTTRNAKGTIPYIRKIIPGGNGDLHLGMTRLKMITMWANIKTAVII